MSNCFNKFGFVKLISFSADPEKEKTPPCEKEELKSLFLFEKHVFDNALRIFNKQNNKPDYKGKRYYRQT